jgi:hypothetical protein
MRTQDVIARDRAGRPGTRERGQVDAYVPGELADRGLGQDGAAG